MKTLHENKQNIIFMFVLSLSEIQNRFSVCSCSAVKENIVDETKEKLVKFLIQQSEELLAASGCPIELVNMNIN